MTALATHVAGLLVNPRSARAGSHPWSASLCGNRLAAERVQPESPQRPLQEIVRLLRAREHVREVGEGSVGTRAALRRSASLARPTPRPQRRVGSRRLSPRTAVSIHGRSTLAPVILLRERVARAGPTCLPCERAVVRGSRRSLTAARWFQAARGSWVSHRPAAARVRRRTRRTDALAGGCRGLRPGIRGGSPRASGRRD